MVSLSNKVDRPRKETSKTSLLNGRSRVFFVLMSLWLTSAGVSFAQATLRGQEPLKTWIDADTGHRVTRVSEEPNSESLYFAENAFTPDGLDMIYLSPKGIHDLKLSTFESNLLVSGNVRGIVVGTKTRRVFFLRDDDMHVHVLDIDTRQETRLAAAPMRAFLKSVNADETLVAGTFMEGTAHEYIYYKLQAAIAVHDALVAERKALFNNHQAKAEDHDATPSAFKVNATPRKDPNAGVRAAAAEMRFAAHSPEDMFTFNLQTGEVKVILKGTDWLNHVQFSPTDPHLIMYAHEGPALKVDRIWTIHSDGTQNRLMHARSNPSEIVTHEFWSRDGKTIWYDLQTEKKAAFALAGVSVETGRRTEFHLEKVNASRHFNAASDNGLFCTDGNNDARGGSAGEEHPILKRQWIDILHPSVGSEANVNQIRSGSVTAEHLVNLEKHTYSSVEPNVRFSPDDRFVIFTSNMFGRSYVFAVEVAKTR